MDLIVHKTLMHQYSACVSKNNSNNITLNFFPANITQYINCTNGDVRLVGGDIMNEGNVQICYNNAWGSVCDNQWDSSDSNVVCYQLGLQPFGKKY